MGIFDGYGEYDDHTEPREDRDSMGVFEDFDGPDNPWFVYDEYGRLLGVVDAPTKTEAEQKAREKWTNVKFTVSQNYE